MQGAKNKKRRSYHQRFSGGDKASPSVAFVCALLELRVVFFVLGSVDYDLLIVDS